MQGNSRVIRRAIREIWDDAAFEISSEGVRASRGNGGLFSRNKIFAVDRGGGEGGESRYASFLSRGFVLRKE